MGERHCEICNYHTWWKLSNENENCCHDSDGLHKHFSTVELAELRSIKAALLNDTLMHLFTYPQVWHLHLQLHSTVCSLSHPAPAAGSTVHTVRNSELPPTTHCLTPTPPPPPPSCRHAEVLVLLMFVLLAVLWFSKDPKFMPGWEALLHLPKTEDGRRCID